jgi:RHS repeat-associated protein
VVGKSSTASVLTSFTYTYTNGANDTPLVQTRVESDAVASNTYTYTYDALNRLTAASVSSGTGTSYSYSYDSDGNLLTKTAGSASTTYAYNGGDELCWAYSGTSTNGCSSAPTGATTYSFDLAGNLTGSSAGASFSYNAKNQTTSITYDGTSLSNLAYTDQGQQSRISAGSTTFDNNAAGTAISTTAGVSTYFFRDDQGDVYGERIGSSSYYYYLTDAEGSVVAVISGDGQTVSDRYSYDPYGTTTYSSGSVANPFGYAGGFTDATGLIHFGARYYDPSTMRWAQVDSLGTGATSPYSYAADDPVNEADQGGLWQHWVTQYVAVKDPLAIPLNQIWLTVYWSSRSGPYITAWTAILHIQSHSSWAFGTWSPSGFQIWVTWGGRGYGVVEVSGQVHFSISDFLGTFYNTLRANLWVFAGGTWWGWGNVWYRNSTWLFTAVTANWVGGCGC